MGNVCDVTSGTLLKVVHRLKEGNKCIPGYSPEEMEVWCDAVDRVNAMTVAKSKNQATMVIESATTLPQW
jgi:hypothetical protein